MIWSEYIRMQGPLAVLFMFFLLTGFCGVLIGISQFYRPDQD